MPDIRLYFRMLSGWPLSVSSLLVLTQLQMNWPLSSLIDLSLECLKHSNFSDSEPLRNATFQVSLVLDIIIVTIVILRDFHISPIDQ